MDLGYVKGARAPMSSCPALVCVFRSKPNTDSAVIASVRFVEFPVGVGERSQSLGPANGPTRHQIVYRHGSLL